ncbi:hypothetical protein V8B55DRAFT_1469143 [Mucor lusitanicus]
MSFHVNFTTHGPELNAAYQAVISEKDDTNWLIYAYDKGTYDLRVQATGDGGLEELNDEFSDGKVQFAYAKVIDPNTELPKFVFVGWSFHVQINARDEADVEPELIMKRVAESSGANYSVHKESAKPQARVTPVGSVYKKTEIPNIAAMQRESMTKENAPKPVGTNYTPVQTTPRKMEQRWNMAQNQDSGANAVRAERERFEKEVRDREMQQAKVQQQQQPQQDDTNDRLQAEAEAAARREQADADRRRREQEAEERRIREQEDEMARQRVQEEEERQRQEEEEYHRRQQAEQEDSERRRQQQEAEEEEERRRQQEQEEQERHRRNAEREEEERREAAERQRRQQEEEEHHQTKEQEEEEKRQRQQEQEEALQSQLNKTADRAVHASQAAGAAAAAPSGPHQGISAVVLFEYDASETNEMSLVEGEVVTQIDQVDEGWWFGVSEDGKKQGLFPANYVQILEEEEQQHTQPAAAAPAAAAADIPAAPPMPVHPEEPKQQQQSQGNVAVALYDYSAEEDNEISFAEGDTITQIEFVSEDWWQGLASNGKTMGLFPANYVELKQ